MPFVYIPDEFHSQPLEALELKILRHLKGVNESTATELAENINERFAKTIGGIATLQRMRFVEQVKPTNGMPKSFRITAEGVLAMGEDKDT